MPFKHDGDRRKRVLVTGGAGFLGSHLVDRLLAGGHTVLCVDNLLTGAARNIAHLDGHPRFAFIQHDVTRPLHLDGAVDEIYNFACPASPVHYQQDPIKTMKTNVLGALNMLGLAKRLNAKILQASTSEVYGDPAVHPQPENYPGRVNPIGPRACYDEGKRAAEALFFDYHRQHGVRIKVARIFNTYGPRMQHADGRVVSNFIVQSLGGKPITVFGDGAQTRSFCYVDDLVDAVLRLMATDEGVTGPVNLGSTEECTILALAQKVQQLAGSNAGIDIRDRPADDPQQRRPDVVLAKRLLGWEPTTPLDKGLPQTMAYFRATLAQPHPDEGSKRRA